MNVPDEGTKLGSAPDKPEGANWAKPLEIIDKVTYRADGARLPQARLRQDLHRRCGRRRAAPADLRRLSRRRARMDAGRPRDPVQRGAQARLGDSPVVDSEIYRLDLASGSVDRADQPQGPGHGARGIARRPHDRLLGFDDHNEGVRAEPHLRDDRHRRRARVAIAPGLDRDDQPDRVGAATAARSIAAYEEDGR